MHIGSLACRDPVLEHLQSFGEVGNISKQCFPGGVGSGAPDCRHNVIEDRLEDGLGVSGSYKLPVKSEFKRVQGRVDCLNQAVEPS